MKSKRSWPAGALLFLSVLILYLAVPTKDFYWDGVGFALSLQHPGWFGMIEANHPIYIGAARSVQSALNMVAVTVPPLRLLQVLNSILGAACVFVLYKIAERLVADRTYSVLVASLFALSATWWKFATDANAYIPAVLLLLIASVILLPGRKARPVMVAAVHTCAMLFHELAVLFVIAAAAGIYCQCGGNRRVAWRKIAIYVATAFVLTWPAYYTCFYLATGQNGVPEFLRWITSHTQDSGFSLALAKNIWLTVRGMLRLALGGSLNLFHSGPVDVASVALLIVIGLALVVRAETKGGRLEGTATAGAAPFLCIWAAVYTAFLFWWMPQNTFYRLFYLPPLVLMTGVALKRRGVGRRAVYVLVALAGTWNFLFYIRPNSLVETNTVLRAALSMQPIWKAGTWIYRLSAGIRENIQISMIS